MSCKRACETTLSIRVREHRRQEEQQEEQQEQEQEKEPRKELQGEGDCPLIQRTEQEPQVWAQWSPWIVWLCPWLSPCLGSPQTGSPSEAQHPTSHLQQRWRLRSQSERPQLHEVKVREIQWGRHFGTQPSFLEFAPPLLASPCLLGR